MFNMDSSNVLILCGAQFHRCLQQLAMRTSNASNNNGNDHDNSNNTNNNAYDTNIYTDNMNHMII